METEVKIDYTQVRIEYVDTVEFDSNCLWILECSLEYDRRMNEWKHGSHTETEIIPLD